MIDGLLRRIAEFHRSRPVVPEFPMVAPVLDALDDARCPATIESRTLPVVQHLDAVEPSADATINAVLDELLRLAPVLPWRQTVGYLDVLSRDYLDNYGYVQLLGPNAIVENPDVRVGIGLWGPNLHYPAHQHEAEELYHVLAGEPSFGDPDGESHVTRPGDAVHHAPWQVHSQDFGATPTVLLYCWTGAVEPDAVLVDAV
ncbi:MAG: hypothetical protein F4126_06720 [Acidimicrobiaceae bacterium]|nr:hypothetical protein [Acidimicrobiaceae bacterium]MYB86993.1 hypothetical protein [Acidimicrobiaceae bacterium]MYH93395.1 hypothetical protein [Acidimicrobiaceae bacterium]